MEGDIYKGRGKKSKRGKGAKSSKGKKKESRFKERTFNKTSADYILERMEDKEERLKVHDLRVFESDEEEKLEKPTSGLMEIAEEEDSNDEGQTIAAEGEDTSDRKKPEKKKRKKKIRKGDLKRKKRQEEEQQRAMEEAQEGGDEVIGNYEEEGPKEIEEFTIKKIEKKLDRTAENGGITAKSLNVIVDKELVIIDKKDIERLREIRAERELAEFETKLEAEKMAKIKQENATELEKLNKKLEEKRLRQQKKKGKKKGKKKRR